MHVQSLFACLMYESGCTTVSKSKKREQHLEQIGVLVFYL
jgi:hypothetical protein